jgi:hypothetical protein
MLALEAMPPRDHQGALWPMPLNGELEPTSAAASVLLPSRRRQRMEDTKNGIPKLPTLHSLQASFIKDSTL